MQRMKGPLSRKISCPTSPSCPHRAPRFPQRERRSLSYVCLPLPENTTQNPFPATPGTLFPTEKDAVSSTSASPLPENTPIIQNFAQLTPPNSSMNLNMALVNPLHNSTLKSVPFIHQAHACNACTENFAGATKLGPPSIGVLLDSESIS